MKNEYMPFGSAMNSFGLINHGQFMDVDQFIEEMNKIFEAVKEFEKDNIKPNDTTRTEIQIPK
jgi:hypothetical protein